MLNLFRMLLLLASAATTVLAQADINLAFVEDKNGQFTNKFCVGILIHTDLVLTSKRCELKFKAVGTANIGLKDRSKLSESEFIAVDKEISIDQILPGALLVRLQRAPDAIQPVEFNTVPLSPGTTVFKAGFRTVFPPNTNALEVQSFTVIPTTSTCRSIVADRFATDAFNRVTGRMICADNDKSVPDNCVDDFGGVLYDANNRVVGFAPTNDSTCRANPTAADQDLPSIYLSAASYAFELRAIICDHTLTGQPQFCVPTASPTDLPTRKPTTRPSPAPSPSPSSSPTSDPNPPMMWCFSAKSKVQVLGKGEIPMEQLEIGDRVLASADGKTYSRVYSFGHKTDHELVEYLQIYTTPNEGSTSRKNKKQPLEISAEHLLYVVKKGASQPTLVRAGDVVVGDAVLITSSTAAAAAAAANHQAKVQSIGKVTRRGAYAPFTFAGNIVVNSVVASNYIALPSPSSNSNKGLQSRLSLEQQHWLGHAAFAPYRVFCQTIGDCQNETYNETTGLSAVATWWISVLGWIEGEACPEVVLTLLVFGISLAEQFRWMPLLAAAVGYYGLCKSSSSGRRRRRHHPSEPRTNDEKTKIAENKVSPNAY